jgi:hypothetical protein
MSSVLVQLQTVGSLLMLCGVINEVACTGVSSEIQQNQRDLCNESDEEEPDP